GVRGEGVALGQQRTEGVRETTPAVVLERVHRRRQRIETGGGGQKQCSGAGGGELGTMAEAGVTRAERDCERRTAARAQGFGWRLHRCATAIAQGRRVREGQRPGARLTIGGED